MKTLILFDTLPNSLKDPNVNPKLKIMEEEGVGVCSLACSISKVEEHIRVSRWGLKQVTSGSIIHIDLHKLNNKLVSM
jgi:hypothetical protein